MSLAVPQIRINGWVSAINSVLQYPKHTDLTFTKNSLPPMPSSFTKRPADNDGQNEDYGVALSDGRGIHVKEYDDHYKIHWDERDPIKDPIGHLIHDASHWLIVIIALIIGIVLLFMLLRRK